MARTPHLTRIVPQAHELLREVLSPGDLAVDLTAGNGHDTLFLCRQVGPEGCVLAFDIQQQALESTAARLRQSGLESGRLGPDRKPQAPGVHLIGDCHARLGRYLPGRPRVVIANLGYLPGGNPTLITEPASTRAALRAGFDCLAPGGRIAVVVYLGHPGGPEEGRAVDELFRSLPADCWQVLRVEAANRPQAPFLLAAQKTSG